MLGFPGGSAGKESACSAGDLGLIPGLGRAPGEGKGYPLQYSGLENPMDSIVLGVEKSQTRLSDFPFTPQFSFCSLHSSHALLPPLCPQVCSLHLNLHCCLFLDSMYLFSSVTQSCRTLCYPMNRSTPGLPVHHHLPELTQTHVHRVGDAIQPFHPLSSPCPPAPNPSQHQSLFK